MKAVTSPRRMMRSTSPAPDLKRRARRRQPLSRRLARARLSAKRPRRSLRLFVFEDEETVIELLLGEAEAMRDQGRGLAGGHGGGSLAQGLIDGFGLRRRRIA